MMKGLIYGLMVLFVLSCSLCLADEHRAVLFPRLHGCCGQSVERGIDCAGRRTPLRNGIKLFLERERGCSGNGHGGCSGE